MNYELALKLKEANFPQSISRTAEYYIGPDTVMLRKDIHKDVYDELGNPVATNQFVYKPTLEDLINALKDKLIVLEKGEEMAIELPIERLMEESVNLFIKLYGTK